MHEMHEGCLHNHRNAKSVFLPPPSPLRTPTLITQLQVFTAVILSCQFCDFGGGQRLQFRDVQLGICYNEPKWLTLSPASNKVKVQSWCKVQALKIRVATGSNHSTLLFIGEH